MTGILAVATSRDLVAAQRIAIVNLQALALALALLNDRTAQ
ncbi:hypothetical protein [Streptomyces sp. NPDC051286]